MIYHPQEEENAFKFLKFDIIARTFPLIVLVDALFP